MEMTITSPIITRRLIIRAPDDADISLMAEIGREDPVLSEFFEGAFSDQWRAAYWKQITMPGVTNGMIFLQDAHVFCGRICATSEDGETPELGITLLKKAQNIGIGPEAIIAFTDWLYQMYGTKRLIVRIAPENERSKHVFEKIGAVFDKRGPRFSDKTIQTLQELHLDTSGMEKKTVLTYYLGLPIQHLPKTNC